MTAQQTPTQEISIEHRIRFEELTVQMREDDVQRWIKQAVSRLQRAIEEIEREAEALKVERDPVYQRSRTDVGVSIANQLMWLMPNIAPQDIVARAAGLDQSLDRLEQLKASAS